jgi:hypothetical protein
VNKKPVQLIPKFLTIIGTVLSSKGASNPFSIECAGITGRDIERESIDKKAISLLFMY